MRNVLVLVLLAGSLAGCHSFHTDPGRDSAFEVQQYNGEAVPWTHLEANNDPDNFQFVIVGDRTGGTRDGVFSNAMHQVNLMQPEFVMSIGDLIKGGRKTDSAEAIDGMWDEVDGFVNALDMPFFYVCGNHDWFNPLLGEKWEEHLGPSYYSFKYRDVLFITLNTQLIINEKNQWPGGHKEQMAFLKETVSRERDVRWTVLLVHHPLWKYKDEPDIPEKFLPTYKRWVEVEDVLKGRKYSLFAGHRHHYQKETRHGLDHITLATTGAGSKLRGPDFGEFDHFLWVTMTDDGPIIANLLLDGVLDPDFKPNPPPSHE